MTLNNNEPQKKPGNDLYDDIAGFEPHRDITLPQGNVGEITDDLHGSATDRMENTAKLTDVQAIIKQLFPKLGYPWLESLEMGRVFAEYHVPLKDIIIKHLLRGDGEKEPVSVAEAIAIAEVAVGIADNGEGRIDAIAVMGQGADAEKAKAQNEMG